ncbi:MAG TPA: type III pantothenate kinase [Bacteroidales bacterium]|nr:type III pantothenate kinase [Bacteroidales bacterium]
MNLIIDQGNTRCKMACMDSTGSIVFKTVLETLTPAALEDVIKRYGPKNGILASVKSVDSQLIEILKSRLDFFIEFGSETPVPIRNGYESTSTLGFDRLAAAVGAWSLQPNKPLLIIDLGTAVTYDFVSEDNVFSGGNIAPGVRTRFKSLNHYTDKLPLLEPTREFNLMGNSTESAIHSGVMQGVLFEINGYIEALTLQHPGLFTFLTGGDLIYFDGKLKNGIFVDENLVLRGLNRILHHNVHS